MRGSTIYRVVRGRYRVLIEERETRYGARSVTFSVNDEGVAEAIAEELRRLGYQPSRVYTDKFGYWRVRVILPRRSTRGAVAVA